MRTALAGAAALVGLGALPAVAGVDIRDLVELSDPSDVAISRKGKQVAWVSTRPEVDGNELPSRLWLWREGGFESLRALRRAITGQEKPKGYRVLTAPGDHPSSPAFSADGHALAFLAARGEDVEM